MTTTFTLKNSTVIGILYVKINSNGLSDGYLNYIYGDKNCQNHTPYEYEIENIYKQALDFCDSNNINLQMY